MHGLILSCLDSLPEEVYNQIKLTFNKNKLEEVLQRNHKPQQDLIKLRRARKRNHKDASLQCNEQVFGLTKTDIKQEQSPPQRISVSKWDTPRQKKRAKRVTSNNSGKDLFEC